MGSFPMGGMNGSGSAGGGSRSHASVPKVAKAVKSKSNSSGRTYTSKFRGVHQTFPTKRWEAQFRRNGKPTSLGKLPGAFSRASSTSVSDHVGLISIWYAYFPRLL